MDPLGLKSALAALPAEARPVIELLMDRIDALEAKASADENALADKVIAALVPQAQAITQTVNAVADQAMRLMRRFDGAGMKFALGPEAQ